MRRIRVGLIGCGGIAQMAHLPHLRDLDDRFEIAALCDVDAALLEEVGRHYRVDARYTNYRDLVRAELDAVLISSPGSHYRPIMAALESGKHVFTEKPMCYTPREAEEIDAAVRASGLKLMVGYMKRYDPGYRYGAERVGAMEDLRYVQVNVLHPSDTMYREHYRLRRGPGLIQTGPVPLPGPGEDEAALLRLATEGEDGALVAEAIGQGSPHQRVAYWLMLASAIHDVNALRGILGEPVEVVSTEVWQSGLCMTSVLRFAPDVRCVLSWISLPYQKNYFEELAFFGTHTRVRIQFPSPYLLHAPAPVIVQRGEDRRLHEERVIVSYDEAFQLELSSFYDCIVNDKQPLTGSADALADIRLLREMALKIR